MNCQVLSGLKKIAGDISATAWQNIILELCQTAGSSDTTFFHPISKLPDNIHGCPEKRNAF